MNPLVALIEKIPFSTFLKSLPSAIRAVSTGHFGSGSWSPFSEGGGGYGGKHSTPHGMHHTKDRALCTVPIGVLISALYVPCISKKQMMGGEGSEVW